ncbi:hypothetical protein WR25_10824 isoform B [Diploscapter pachys]|uniref:ACB domain-containing protein n=1 Tax=Diploscapter pachys TaxID=2018661 RepID=A0A2A2JAW7_9BILA|nr:hypothetical protein WR25_10824 isoform B [Diploscapter pachys]
MSLDDKFNAAVKIVQNLPKDGPLTTSNSQKLTFYSLFKQATVGDCNTERPGMLAFTEKAKWDAWNGVKGMSAEEAKQKYVDEINSVFDKAAEVADT